MYRVGHNTPDQFLNTPVHINPNATYLPIAVTGGFSLGPPDSGLGLAAEIFVNDRVNLAALVSDADVNRFRFGDVGHGKLFSAAELQGKVSSLTANAGYSKVTVWHNDCTQDRKALNENSGMEGWRIFSSTSRGLSCDGRAVAIGRWGKI